MKPSLTLRTALIALVCIMASAVFIGCISTPKVTTNPDGTLVTNVVKTVDPVKLDQIRKIVEPGASSALRRAMAKSPQHAPDIAMYATAIGSIFCDMQSKGNFSVGYLIDAADKATLKLQQKAAGNNDWTQELIDAKNVAVNVYDLAAGDSLTWQVPDNAWLRAVTDLICNSVNQALKDSGYTPIK